MAQTAHVAHHKRVSHITSLQSIWHNDLTLCRKNMFERLPVGGG